MTTEFNVGDYVIITDNRNQDTFYSDGATGRVEFIDNDGDLLILFDDGYNNVQHDGQPRWWARANMVAKVKQMNSEDVKTEHERKLMSRFAKYL